jgi:hypothetical protein
MADDDERFRRAARPAIVNARGRLDQARVNLEAARKEFAGTGGQWMWGTIEDKLRSNRDCVGHYKQLQSAIAAAESAIVRAGVACDALNDIVGP